MENEFNSKIEDILSYLLSKKNKKQIKTSKGIQTRLEIIQEIRKILDMDEQCFVCRQFKFKYELSLVESMNEKVCQDCAEKLLNGVIKLNENV